DGATFKTTDSDFLVSDNHDFHPTDVLEDADGSLLVVDTGGWYKICCPTSQLVKPDVLGGIYRIRKKGAPKINDPRGLKIDWEKLSDSELVGLLDDRRPVVRHRAVATLAKRKNVYPALFFTVHNPDSYSAERVRNAIWCATRVDARTAAM